ncbi:MAG: hypothetical protein HQ548_07255, partial [Chloroflexi bacterium]|nr:hypothetical protein [Chloroflexota bacterium]
MNLPNPSPATFRCLAATAGALALVAFGFAVPAHADAPGIQLISASAASELPEGVRFVVEAESNAPITDVLVRFTVVG